MYRLRRPKLQFSLRIGAALVTLCGFSFAWVRSHVLEYRAEQRFIFELDRSPVYFPPIHARLTQPSGEVIEVPVFW